MMVKTIMIFIISFIFLMISIMVKLAYKNENFKRANYKHTLAIIERSCFSEEGKLYYYVSFFDNGNKFVAQTDRYTFTTKTLESGDEVDIGYYFTKRGTPRAVILDTHFVPCSNSVPGFYRLFAFIGIVLFFIAILALNGIIK